ncbi:MAG: tyrosine-type recombinase/integrase [Dehalococcoidia bacterium]
MARAASKTPPQSTVRTNAKSFLRHLRAENLSPNTIASYQASVEQFCSFIEANGMPARMPDVKREHVEMWIEDLLASRSAATANNRYRGLHQFWKWAEEEGEVTESPMRRMSPPKVPESLVPVLSEVELARLIKACSGTGFYERRDTALLMCFMSSGARKSEIGNLRWSDGDATQCDLDLDTARALIKGKGGRDRIVDLTPKTVKALDRYIRIRSGHRDAEFPWLWLGKRGRLTPTGCARALEQRAEQAGIGKIHVHQLRHSFAHYWLLDGGAEESLMRNMGWKSREMLSRYAASSGQERALLANRRVGLGSRF